MCNTRFTDTHVCDTYNTHTHTDTDTHICDTHNTHTPTHPRTLIQKHIHVTHRIHTHTHTHTHWYRPTYTWHIQFAYAHTHTHMTRPCCVTYRTYLANIQLQHTATRCNIFVSQKTSVWHHFAVEKCVFECHMCDTVSVTPKKNLSYVTIHACHWLFWVVSHVIHTFFFPRI